MPYAFIYLGIMLAVICLWFGLFKRPIYEAIFVSFMTLLAMTGAWDRVGVYVQAGLKTSLLYSMTMFIALSLILTRTKIIDSAVAIILSLLGRVTGGAGYVAVIASSFMGALSGSGAGNVMTTGTITIPAMKKAGFPPELAANIESASSCLGNMIPPSANIVAALGVLTALYPENDITIGRFWIVCWGCSLWFILQRLLTVFAFCKYYKVKPLTDGDVPCLWKTIREGWQGILLPFIILLPFVLDYFFKGTFFTARLGASGAKNFSSSLLYFIAGVGAIYTMLVAKEKSGVTPKALANTFSSHAENISRTVGACLFGYMIGALFKDLNVSEELKTFIEGLNLGKFGLALFIPLITCFMGMIIPGSSVVVMFGPVFVSLFVSAGADPLLTAAMLPCICGVMEGITPPLALCMYAGMSLAESDFGKTVRNDLWWVLLQYALEVAILAGLLPVWGL